MKKPVVLFAVAALAVASCLTGCMRTKGVEIDTLSVGDSAAPRSPTIGRVLASAAPPPSPPRLMAAGGGVSAVATNRPVLASLASDPGQVARLMIYNATLSLVVQDIATAFDTIKATAEGAGGYMQTLNANSIQVKIPAAKFHEAITAFERLGEVTGKQINGTDITDKMRDLRIRLKNAEEMRERLVAILERANKVEDALKVEQELGRVTETIELLKGQIYALEHQVAYSTITVQVNSPLPQRQMKEEIPFPWVRALAGDMTKGTVTDFSALPRAKGIRLDLPESFAKYFQAGLVTRATSADGVLLKVERHDNVEGADLEFWTNLAKRSLTATHVITVNNVTDTTLERGVEAKIIEGVKSIGGTEFTYLAALAPYDDYVFTYEAWGSAEKFGAVKSAIEMSIRTMDVRRSARSR